MSLIAKHVSKTYRGHRAPNSPALENVSISVPNGHVHALIGPNGSGKTTFCKLAAGILRPDCGSLLVDGHHAHDVEPDSVTLVLGGDQGLYYKLSPLENVRYWAVMHGESYWRARNLALRTLDELEFPADRIHVPVAKLSRGQKQKIHLAIAFVSHATLILLDEPSTGLDPLARDGLQRAITRLRDEGRSVLLTTHDMIEAENVADMVTLLDRGHVVLADTAERILGDASTHRSVDISFSHMSKSGGPELESVEAIARLNQLDTKTRYGSLIIECIARERLASVVDSLERAGVRNLTVRAASLDELYRHIYSVGS